MRTFLKLLFIVIVSGCDHEPQPLKTGLEGKPIPEFSLMLPDSSLFSTAAIKGGQASILFHFTSDCPYCKIQLKSLIDNMDVLSSIQFYLITPSSLADIRKFIKDNELSKFSNMVVALDYQGFFMKYINNASVPLTAIYNDKRNFVVAYVGNIDAVLLKQIVSK